MYFFFTKIFEFITNTFFYSTDGFKIDGVGRVARKKYVFFESMNLCIV